MSKIIKFSTYLQYADGSHRKQPHTPTFFVEQVLNSLGVDMNTNEYYLKLVELNPTFDEKFIYDFLYGLNTSIKDSKIHTILSPKKPFKVGYRFTPAIWSGVPSKSPQIVFWDDIEVKQTWDILLEPFYNYCKINDIHRDFSIIDTIAKNDGLSKKDFLKWFGEEPFSGQIICWSDKIKYSNYDMELIAPHR